MTAPILLWFRRDLRLSDHPALAAALASGAPVVPVFLNDEVLAGEGAAARWRMGLALDSLDGDLRRLGARIVLRRGGARHALQALIAETGARTVYWTRLYDPASRARDTEVKAALKAQGIDARSFPGHVLHEPWTVETGQGGFYRVYTPFWKAVRDRTVAPLLPAPGHWPVPETWPASDQLADWRLAGAMGRGADIVARHATVGEAAAQARLDRFISDRVDRYKELRDFPGLPATSGLSENLTYGEISPARVWHAGWSAMERGAAGSEHFLKELVWRDFAWHLIHHSPEIASRNWRPDWDDFPWQGDPDAPEVTAWKQGRTGVPFVDAAMREMYVTGTMHNRARMIAASYLTKHLMVHWKIGLEWFADCLTDWDPASNAMGWQWVAGSGPDAAPYFRIFNPDGQAEKFDADGRYRSRWIAEGAAAPTATALSYFDAVPKSWNLSPDAPYPGPLIALDQGRARALAAYRNRPNTPTHDGK